MGFFEKLKGYDDEVTHEFTMALNSQGEDNATTIVNGISIHMNTNIINRVNTLRILMGKINYFSLKRNPLNTKMG